MSKNINQETQLRFQKQSAPVLVLSMSAPIAVSLLVQALYNIVDSVYISSYSEHGLTAVSLAFPLHLILVSIGSGTATGTGILLSRAMGANESRSAHQLCIHGLISALLNWLLVCITMLPLLSGYYLLFTNTLQVSHMGVSYCRTLITLSVFQFLESSCTRITQAKGNTFLPMLYQSAGAIINIILDPILIFGIGPFPALEIQGAAIATVVGQAFSALCALAFVVYQMKPVPFKFSRGDLSAIYCTGLPTMLILSLVSVYIIGLNGILSKFSDEAVTTLGIYYKLQTFLLIIVNGIDQGVLPVLAFNIGAKNMYRTWLVWKVSLLLSTISLIMWTIITNFFLFPILSLFSPSQELIITAAPALRKISLAFPLFGITILTQTILQAAGRLKQCLCIVLLRQIVLLVPLAKALSYFGLAFVWYTFPISEIIAVFLCGCLLRNLYHSLN